MGTKDKILAVVLGVAFLALTACSPSSPPVPEDPDEAAVVKQFFAYLEAGEASKAAALTTVELDPRTTADEVYRASAARPTGARIIEDSGFGSITVAYDLDGEAVELRVAVEEDVATGDLKIARWGFQREIVGTGGRGTLVINGQVEFSRSMVLYLLPGKYRSEFKDPTGLLTVGERDSPYTVVVPYRRAITFLVSPEFRDDVRPGFNKLIDNLEKACEKERFVGPSCPLDVAHAVGEPVDGVDVRWHNRPNPPEYKDGKFTFTVELTVRLTREVRYIEGSYSGVLTRKADGSLSYDRSQGR